MAYVEVKCPYCESTEVNKSGKNATGRQRYKCKGCHKTFQLEYKNKASDPEVKKQIVPMVMNGSGTRDTARVLGISKDTVTSTLKKLKKIVKPVNQEYLKKKFC